MVSMDPSVSSEMTYKTRKNAICNAKMMDLVGLATRTFLSFQNLGMNFLDSTKLTDSGNTVSVQMDSSESNANINCKFAPVVRKSVSMDPRVLLNRKQTV